MSKIPGFTESDVGTTININKVIPLPFPVPRKARVLSTLSTRDSQSYAKKYEAQKRLEELSKFRHGASDLIDADGSESSSETEDEDGELLTPAMDMQIMNVVEVGHCCSMNKVDIHCALLRILIR